MIGGAHALPHAPARSIFEESSIAIVEDQALVHDASSGPTHVPEGFIST